MLNELNRQAAEREAEKKLKNEKNIRSQFKGKNNDQKQK